MKVTTERLENCQIKMIVELDAADVDKRLRQTARKLSRQFNVPGYRRGRAPFHTVIRVFGREAVQQQALEDWGNDLYEEAIKEIEYEPYQVGELDDVEWDPFVMTVLVPIRPEVDLGDYRAVRVDYAVEEISDEQIDEVLAEIQQQYAQWVPVERPAAMGDQVVLDFEGKVEDTLFMSNQEHEMVLQEGVNYPLEGFHEEIVGLSPGEDKTFTLMVPEDDFEEGVAGQEGTITVHLHTVKEEDLPPLDDELAMMVGDYDTLDALKAATRENLETEALQQAESEYVDKALDAIIEAAARIEYPAQAVDEEMEMALAQMERNLAASGIQLDTYLQMLGKPREMYKQELRPASEERLKKRLVMVEVAQREKLMIDDEEIDAEIDRLSEMMGERAGEMRELLESPGGRMSVADDLMVARVQERIAQIAKGEAPPLEEEEKSEEETEAEEEGDEREDKERDEGKEEEAKAAAEGEESEEPEEDAAEAAEEPEAQATKTDEELPAEGPEDKEAD